MTNTLHTNTIHSICMLYIIYTLCNIQLSKYKLYTYMLIIIAVLKSFFNIISKKEGKKTQALSPNSAVHTHLS